MTAAPVNPEQKEKHCRNISTSNKPRILLLPLRTAAKAGLAIIASTMVIYEACFLSARACSERAVSVCLTQTGLLGTEQEYCLPIHPRLAVVSA